MSVLVSVHFHARGYFAQLAVDAHVEETFLAVGFKKLFVMALAVFHKRSQHINLAVGKTLVDKRDYALGGIFYHHLPGEVAARLPHSGKEQAKEVEHLRCGADGRPRIAVYSLLLNGYDRAEACDIVDIGAFEIAEHIAGIGRECLYIPTLAFGIDSVESKRRLARAAQPGDYDQTVERQLYIDIFQIVYSRTSHRERMQPVV